MLDLLLQSYPLLIEATFVTCGVGVAFYVLALVVGLAVALSRLFGSSWLQKAAAVFVSFFIERLQQVVEQRYAAGQPIAQDTPR